MVTVFSLLISPWSRSLIQFCTPNRFGKACIVFEANSIRYSITSADNFRKERATQFLILVHRNTFFHNMLVTTRIWLCFLQSKSVHSVNYKRNTQKGRSLCSFFSFFIFCECFDINLTSLKTCLWNPETYVNKKLCAYPVHRVAS